MQESVIVVPSVLEESCLEANSIAVLFKGVAINGREGFYDGIRVKGKGIKKFPGGNRG